MVSKIQWKPFWLATQWDPQNDWTATQNRVNYDVFAQALLELQYVIWPVVWKRVSFIIFRKKVSRQRPRSTMTWKTLEKSGLELTCGTKSPSRSEALRFRDSAKSPSTNLDGSWWILSAGGFGAAGSSSDFSGVFSRHGASFVLKFSFHVLHCRTQVNPSSYYFYYSLEPWSLVLVLWRLWVHVYEMCSLSGTSDPDGHFQCSN